MKELPDVLGQLHRTYLKRQKFQTLMEKTEFDPDQTSIHVVDAYLAEQEERIGRDERASLIEKLRMIASQEVEEPRSEVREVQYWLEDFAMDYMINAQPVQNGDDIATIRFVDAYMDRFAREEGIGRRAVLIEFLRKSMEERRECYNMKSKRRNTETRNNAIGGVVGAAVLGGAAYLTTQNTGMAATGCLVGLVLGMFVPNLFSKDDGLGEMSAGRQLRIASRYAQRLCGG